MTTAYKGERFCLAERMIDGYRDLAIMGDDGLFCFSDGDEFSPEAIELEFINVEFLSLYQLEYLLNGQPT